MKTGVEEGDKNNSDQHGEREVVLWVADFAGDGAAKEPQQHDEEGRLDSDQLEARVGEHSGTGHASNDNRHGDAGGDSMVFRHGGCGDGSWNELIIATRKMWKSKKMTLGLAL